MSEIINIEGLKIAGESAVPQLHERRAIMNYAAELVALAPEVTDESV